MLQVPALQLLGWSLEDALRDFGKVPYVGTRLRPKRVGSRFLYEPTASIGGSHGYVVSFLVDVSDKDEVGQVGVVVDSRPGSDRTAADEAYLKFAQSVGAVIRSSQRRTQKLRPFQRQTVSFKAWFEKVARYVWLYTKPEPLKSGYAVEFDLWQRSLETLNWLIEEEKLPDKLKRPKKRGPKAKARIRGEQASNEESIVRRWDDRLKKEPRLQKSEFIDDEDLDVSLEDFSRIVARIRRKWRRAERKCRKSE
ncbi:hypothetical protein GC176_12795 [bacterium]|nr:hypothetical protein [bacterium]